MNDISTPEDTVTVTREKPRPRPPARWFRRPKIAVTDQDAARLLAEYAARGGGVTICAPADPNLPQEALKPNRTNRWSGG